jgi:hypothetical protein
VSFIRKNIKLIFLLVIPVYFYIAHTSILNKHTHFYSNGIVVTHSHPVDGEHEKPINEHHHSKTEICFFHCFYTEPFDVPELFVFKFEIENQTRHFFIANEKINSSTSIKLSDPRGPPSMFS